MLAAEPKLNPRLKPKRRLKVLCLHGYTQDASIFKTMLRNHTTELQPNVDFVFIDAPNILRPYDIDGIDNMARTAATAKLDGVEPRELKAWYSLKNDNPEIVQGLNESIAFLDTVLDEQGPFDGIFGFSQGGLVSAVLCSLLECRSPLIRSSHGPFKFAILCSAYKLKDSQWTQVYERPIRTPSLHVFGVLDGMISINRSMELRDCFVNPEELCHVGT
ncbi:Ovarian cancer-associated protein 2 [Kickxella alabastrina]|uniref:Ovarian cancer-associated protein 2 n=1 Tax=Kickxella alabastrina TaxID=61397 RepID=A0ACC1IQ09_9FUNG|nr:Ovarian cancer-associated protein 2 [Kickxella alabastrina]